MITFHDKRTKIKMPQRLDEIPLEQGIQIMELIGDEEPSFVLKVSIIAMLSGLDAGRLAKIKPEVINTIFNHLEIGDKREILLRFMKTFSLKKKEFGILDFDNITVREYGEIEFWMGEGDYSFSKLAEMMCVIFRPIKRRNKSIKNILLNTKNKIFFKTLIPLSCKRYEIEDYKDDHLKNKELFMEHLDFNFGYSVLQYVLKFKVQLRDEYTSLFKSDEQLELERDDPMPGDPNIKDFADIWGFYHIIDEFSADIFERDRYWKMPLREFYKYLTYRKQKVHAMPKNNET